MSAPSPRPSASASVRGGLLFLVATCVAAAPLAAQQREPVLRQVKIPHRYYWREMYVPQATSGPSAAAWSPNGRELVYSMQGSLWRQRVDGDTAQQLTDGPGYDYQPDWSPDGRLVAYASYRDDAMELRVLDLVSGRDTALIANGAVNLEPRWSPDGGRLAYVSTEHQGRWHVYVAAVRDGHLLRTERVTEDHDSGLPRYYYSVFDHYLSPVWSPDGRELILVSNRGHIWGTGGFWRMEARPGAPMRELHYEETTWKARPDWSPDGRVAYSGYQGGQWNHLWLMTADGGDPLQLTYGEFDATAPRWSHDGRRIVYVSNENGNTALRTIEIPGGRQRSVQAHTRRYRRAVGRLRVLVADERTAAPVPARVSVRGSDGRSYTPDDTWRHADEAFVRGEQRMEYGYFHTAGRAELTVPAESVTVDVWRGPEHAAVTLRVAVPAGGERTVRVAPARLADLPARGWWGGDLHVHMNYGGAYRNTPAHLALQSRAEGLNVVENLVVNKEQRVPDIASFSPRLDPVSTRGFLLAYGQEFHTSVWGHAALLGLRDHYLLPDHAGYVNTAASSLIPTNAEVHDLARAQGGILGYVHPFDTRPDPFDTAEPLLYELPVDVALGKVEYLEVMGYSDHLITSEVWYRLLNCGFRLPAGAGTDAFPNYASLRGPPGLVRVYVRSGPRLDHRRWLEGLVAGRTFVTNAPLLDFTLDGRGPGEEVGLPAGRYALRAHVSMRSAVPVDHLELIGNGRVVASVRLRGDHTSADTVVELPTERSGWYVLRAWSNRPRLPVLDLYPFASTSPVYVQVGGAGVRSRADADYFVAWLDRVEAGVRAHTGWNTAAERDSVLALLAAARTELERRR